MVYYYIFEIITLDPMTGTKEEARAVESQAIARAYRQVNI